jgi:transcriptional regulator with XRE-family HTH domain
LLVYLRERRGWTQQQLATVAGYSERLISKAESGRPISATAVDDIAGALSIAEEQIHPEDIISDPLARAKEYVTAHYIHQADIIRSVRHFIDDDVVHVMHGDPSVIPFAGTRRGIDELEETFRVFFSLMEVPKNYDFEPDHTYMSEGNQVVVFANSWIHPKGQPMEKPMQLTQRFQFCRGKIVHIEIVFDTSYGEELLRPQSNGDTADCAASLPLEPQLRDDAQPAS